VRINDELSEHPVAISDEIGHLKVGPVRSNHLRSTSSNPDSLTSGRNIL
jgi:hypothetical protein